MKKPRVPTMECGGEKERLGANLSKGGDWHSGIWLRKRDNQGENPLKRGIVSKEEERTKDERVREKD